MLWARINDQPELGEQPTDAVKECSSLIHPPDSQAVPDQPLRLLDFSLDRFFSAS
jgi:hypothetical protein